MRSYYVHAQMKQEVSSTLRKVPCSAALTLPKAWGGGATTEGMNTGPAMIAGPAPPPLLLLLRRPLHLRCWRDAGAAR